MARKTKAEKAQEALEAETALNTTREDILVRPGQMWRDLNPRSNGRMISIGSVEKGLASITDGRRQSTLRVERMYPHSRGYELFGSP